MSRQLMKGLLEHLEQVGARFGPLQEPIIAYIAGGVAVNYYTGMRMSDDTDIAWSHRVLIPQDLKTFVSEDLDGSPILVSMDANFSDVLGLFHPDWKADAREVAKSKNMIVKIISPVDLIVSKIGRFIEQDRDDICDLARSEQISKEEVRARAEEALDCCVGDIAVLKQRIELAMDIIDECQNRGDSHTP